MTKEVREDFIREDADLSEQQKKYCRCLLKVQDKGRGYSPYGVCTKSTRVQVRSCSEYYDFEAMDLPMLIAYANLHKLTGYDSSTRESVLKAIYDWKQSKYSN